MGGSPPSARDDRMQHLLWNLPHALLQRRAIDGCADVGSNQSGGSDDHPEHHGAVTVTRHDLRPHPIGLRPPPPGTRDFSHHLVVRGVGRRLYL